MDTFDMSHTPYTVLPVKVINSSTPWVEICTKGNIDRFIVIDPVIADDPLNMHTNISVFNGTSNNAVDCIYGEYIALPVNSDEPDYGAVIATVACLSDSSPIKHIFNSTFIALTHLLNVYKSQNNCAPLIIINTKYPVSSKYTDTWSEMVREITAAFLNCYYEYPTILVTFIDDTTLTDLDITFKSTKKKKHKKK
jgi:hypothetical protein